MILTKGDFTNRINNKNCYQENKYLLRENKILENKQENKYFHKRNNKIFNYNSLKEILNENTLSKNSKGINDKKVENKKLINQNIKDNQTKRYNINSTKTRNKITKYQNNNMKGIETEDNVYNKAIYNHFLYNTNKINKKVRQKNISMELRNKNVDEDIFLSENKEENNKKDNIYSRPKRRNSPNSYFENQFNIKDAKNILNINYFCDKNRQNIENFGELFYTDFNKSNFGKDNRPINKNQYSSLLVKDRTNRNPEKIPTKTTNSFYIRKNPINVVKNINDKIIKDEEITHNENIKNIRYIETDNKNISRKNRNRYHSSLNENDLDYSPDRYFTSKIMKYLINQNDKKIINRNGNKIKILKKYNNTAIQEYNLSLGNESDSDSDFGSYENEMRTNSNFRRNKRNLLKNNIIKRNQEFDELKKYYQNFTKNIRPIKNFQFEIKNNESKLNSGKKNFINVNKAHKNSFHKRNILANKKSFTINKTSDESNKNNLVDTPNFYEICKTPINRNLIVYNLEKLKKNIFSTENGLKISENEKFEIIKKENKNNNEPNKDNNFVFKNEDDMINYIFNKFEEERKKKNYFNRKLRFTGFILTKKYKGKNLCDIRIEDDIDKINEQLKKENILINDKRVVFKYIENINNINILEEDNKKLKEENEKLKQKDEIKNELIKKLDIEKQNLNDEIIKLKKELEELKNQKSNK